MTRRYYARFMLNGVILQFGAEEELSRTVAAVVRPRIWSMIGHVLTQSTGRCEHRRAYVTCVATIIAALERVLNEMFLQLDATRQRFVTNVAIEFDNSFGGDGRCRVHRCR